MKNILFIGGTGYIGGPILSRFLQRHDPSLTISALVRSPDKAAKLRALHTQGVQINVVVGSHNDAALVEALVAEADVVFSLADCDDLQAAQSILRGLKKRFDATGVKPTLIHMSGTGCLGDRAKGEFSSSTVYNDMDIAQIETLPATQPHRNVDLAIVEADSTQGYTNAYIVLPGIVYGKPHGILVDAGIQNPTNLALSAYIKACFERKAAGIVGLGKNVISHVDVTEVADQVELLYNAIHSPTSTRSTGSEIDHGKNGYYFVANGEVEFEKVAEIVEKHAGLPRRAFSDAEMPAYFPSPSLQGFFGDNGRCDSQRSYQGLGWKPVKTTVDFLDAVREEVKENWNLV
ncbi:NmrA domain-containing protein [Favolaschia claudopus]|uniref:NmrA domain-containing protein n=1 Tax=Favolaschia claudopus TaxID=2862362 RepID=A0AAW0CA11_9AGAR